MFLKNTWLQYRYLATELRKSEGCFGT
jgi:hypothetical protein